MTDPKPGKVRAARIGDPVRLKDHDTGRTLGYGKITGTTNGEHGRTLVSTTATRDAWLELHTEPAGPYVCPPREAA